MNSKHITIMIKIIAVVLIAACFYACSQSTGSQSSSSMPEYSDMPSSSVPANPVSSKEESLSASSQEGSSIIEESSSENISSSEPPVVSTPEPSAVSSSAVASNPSAQSPGSSSQMVSSSQVLSSSSVSSAVSSSLVSSVSTSSAATSDTIREPVASGSVVYTKGGSTIDASNISEGYIMVSQTGISSKLKLQVITTQKTYNYNLNNSGIMEVFPLQMGDGEYTLKIMQNVSGTSYAAVYLVKINVTLASSTICYLYPSQYVNYNSSSSAVAKSFELCTNATTELDKIKAVYNYVISNISYDKDKAANVTSLTGYLPEVDDTLSTGKGICFDYAVLFAAMLRVQNIPTRLVIGTVSSAGYSHAWNQVYITGVGWVTTGIYFDGKSWVRMDPTFAASGGSDIEAYIGNGSNYTATRIY